MNEFLCALILSCSPGTDITIDDEIATQPPIVIPKENEEEKPQITIDDE